jgi:hypothetical protein
MPVDIAEVQRRQDRVQAGVAIAGGVWLTAVSLGLNIWLAATGWMYSTGILLTVVGVMMFCSGVKQLWQYMRASRKS